MSQLEIIEYRGQPINVGKYREIYQGFNLRPERIEELVQRKVRQKKQFIGRILGREAHDGYRLAFYQQEHQLFSETYEIKVSDKDAKKIVKKLLRHFGTSRKAKAWEVRFFGNHQSGSCGWNIRLSHNPSIGLICHEVAHTFHLRHDKKLLRYIKRMIIYCQKNSYWMYVIGESKN